MKNFIKLPEMPGKEVLLPFILTGIVILVDQVSKILIVHNWPIIGTMINDVFNNDFLVIYHVRNKAIAFSIGAELPIGLQTVLFIVLPIGVLIFLVGYYLKTEDFNNLQRWAIAGIIGGGLGNIIDRIFRPDGVVDFISVKFYGLFGLDRWPTFNFADTSVVICCFILIITMIFGNRKKV